MKRFVKTFILFCVVSLLCIIVLIVSLYYLSEQKKYSSENGIFIWGDSQTCQGIDIPRLRSITGHKIYSSAKHGAGVYDFLVFSEYVPDGSICIVGYSQLCLLRDTHDDNNRSGINYQALIRLLSNNYSLKDIIKILSVNKFMRTDIFQQNSSLYEYSDTITTLNYLEGIIKLYEQEPIFYNDKYSIFTSGVNTLCAKNCKIIYVAFPYYSSAAECYKHSSYRNHIDNDICAFAEKYTAGTIDTIYVMDTDSLLMHDLTHLNEIGAKRVTDSLIQYINLLGTEHMSNKIVLFNDWSCN